MRTTHIVAFLFAVISWTAESKPMKENAQNAPQTNEEVKEFLWKELEKMMEEFSKGKPSRPFTPKQQAWFDSLGVRTPQLEKRENAKIRKEVRQLSEEEWLAYTDAVKAANNAYPDPEDDRSHYMLLAEAHFTINSMAAHWGTAFLPWHREYTWRLERAVQIHNPEVAVPYWDTSLDSSLPDPKDTVLFSEHLFGNADGLVSIGPFANFKILSECHTDDFPSLYRNTSANDLEIRQSLLFKEEYIEESLNGTHFANLSYLRSPLETYHGGPHAFTGGVMVIIKCAATDPLFFSHHSFIDWIFQEFREKSQITPLETEYPTEDEVDIGGARHEAYADMNPFPGVLNIHGISSHYTNYYYNYAKRHYTSCATSSDCTSQYLWCDVTQGRCVSKIREGGVCTGLTDESCYGDNYACVNNICTDANSENVV